MRVVAAAAVGVACALAVGLVLGAVPQVRPARRSPRRRRDAQAWLLQAGVPLTPARFRLTVGAVVAATLVMLTAVTGSVFVAAVPALAVGLAPRAFFARRRRARLRAVQAAWPDALRDLLSSIGAGRSLTQALGALATTGPPALREPFTRFPERARVLGTTMALERVKEELADSTSDRVIEVLLLAHERGGTIVRTILEDLARATTKDLKLAGELETESLEARVNARAVVVLPWLVLVALTARPGPFRDFYRSTAGVVTLGIGALMSAAGVAILGRLTRAPVEERVLAGRAS
jgi:tight adherence protein B